MLPSSLLAVVPLLPPPPPFSPPQLILSPTAPEGPGGKGCSPFQLPVHPAKHWVLEGGRLTLGRTEGPGATHSEESTAGKQKTPQGSPLCREPSPSWRLPCDTALSPRLPRAVPRQHPAGMATEPGAPRVSPGMLALATLTSFSSPCLPWGREAGCCPCAPAEPGAGPVPLPREPCPEPVPELGPAAPGSARLLCSSRAGQGERGERGGRRGGGK